MALQKVFKPDYIKQLRNNIQVENYLADKFPYDESQVRYLANVSQPVDLLSKLDPTPKGDLQSAIAIYEAYPKISPVFAQQDDLWVYLTHADLFDYVKERWPIPELEKDERKCRQHIINHFHHNSMNFLRTTFAGLWWHVHLTVDDKRVDKYELTRILFNSGQDFRTLRFGELSFIRYKESMIGILEFLKENPGIVSEHFVPRGQYISRYLNILGGTKQLASLDRNYFKFELDKIKNRLFEIHTLEDVQNKQITV